MTGKFRAVPESAGGRREACLCSTLRAASRRVTQLYDEALAPVGLTITGYFLLSRIGSMDQPSMNELAEVAAMDHSTISRSMRPLLDAGLVVVRTGTDRRRKEFALTAKGKRVRAAAFPHWQDAQRDFKSRYGVAESALLTAMLMRTIELPA